MLQPGPNLGETIQLSEKSIGVCRNYLAGIKARIENPKPLYTPGGQAVQVRGPTDHQVLFNLVDTNIVLLTCLHSIMAALTQLLEKDSEKN